MNTLMPLLAAIEPGLIKILIWVAVIVLWGLAQLISRLKKAPQPRPRVGLPQQPLANDIDEFLRRAAERSKRKGVEPAARPTLQELPAAPRAAAAPKVSGDRPVVAETGNEAPIGRQVTEHVAKYLDEEDFARRSAQLGAEVAEIDRQVDQHLHQTFDHTLSKLAAVPGEAAAPSLVESAESDDAAASVGLAGPASLVLALADPDSIRQAIILNEILHRPEERWA
jgi:hypothetical protein